jgi:hypothetical protein
MRIILWPYSCHRDDIHGWVPILKPFVGRGVVLLSLSHNSHFNSPGVSKVLWGSAENAASSDKSLSFKYNGGVRLFVCWRMMVGRMRMWS